MVAAGPVGALVGVLLGHQFDRGLEINRDRGNGRRRRRGSRAARQQVFFETTFLVMGHLAKADGRVSEEEIRSARTVMHQMRLRPEDVRLAIDLFTRGKARDFDVGSQVARFRELCGREPDLVRALLEIQLELALTGGISARERDLLWRIADSLGVGRVELAHLEAIVRARRNFRGAREQRVATDGLQQAYKALGVAPGVSDQEVKTAYRRLMNQHHPDKLVARGLPESMLDAAKERTREIRSAYERVREHRGMK